MASLSDKNCDNPARFHEISHFVEWSYYFVIMLAIKFFSSSFQVDSVSLFKEQR